MTSGMKRRRRSTRRSIPRSKSAYASSAGALCTATSMILCWLRFLNSSKRICDRILDIEFCLLTFSVSLFRLIAARTRNAASPPPSPPPSSFSSSSSSSSSSAAAAAAAAASTASDAAAATEAAAAAERYAQRRAKAQSEVERVEKKSAESAAALAKATNIIVRKNAQKTLDELQAELARKRAELAAIDAEQPQQSPA